MRIADFGISGMAASRAIGEARRGVSSRGAVLATAARGAYTPNYASPQQVRGESPDPRDDVFALGVIWYQMLTGDFGSGRPGGRWRRQLTERGMSASLLDLLEGCVDDRPDERPEDAVRLSELLGLLLAPKPPAPAPVPVQPVAKKPVSHPNFLKQAESHLEKGDFERAIENYTEAIRLDPSPGRTWIGGLPTA